MTKKEAKQKMALSHSRRNWPIPSETIFRFIRGDFEKLWDAAVGFDGGKGAGGNYNFGLFSILFLEWICRVAKPNEQLSNTFAETLYEIEPKYFTKLSTRPTTISGEVKLPKPTKCGTGTFLLDLIYHQIRNGHSHAYHQNVAALKGGSILGFSIQMHNLTIKELQAYDRTKLKHLEPNMVDENQLIINFNPALFYCDIKNAAVNSKVVEIEPTFSMPMITVLSDKEILEIFEKLRGANH